MTPVMTRAEMQDYLWEVFPQIRGHFSVEHIDGAVTVMRMPVTDQNLRPGGTVSGPTMFALADVAAYAATLAHIGREALAVTTNCSIDFMRKPSADADLIATAEVLKLGKSLSVVDIRICSEGQKAPVARATLTYSIPPKRD
ncbi:MAG: PaaI family thioesterase [Cognatishimia sp.]